MDKYVRNSSIFEKLILLIPVAVCLVLLSSCAVPIPPSGGPEDSIPPRLVESSPADAGVNISADRIRFTFNERLSERTIRSALSIFPEFSRPVQIDFKGDGFEILFPEVLRPNTTYIITLDTELRDARNVAIPAPISVAFGTGPVLNSGRLSGVVRDEFQGEPSAGADIFLFSAADTAIHVGDSGNILSLDRAGARPVYRSQTNESGTFELSYLAQGEYVLLALSDKNRNQRLDADESFDIRERTLGLADSTHLHINRALVLAARDHAPPELRQVRATANSEIGLTFSENVRLLEQGGGAISVVDSVSGRQLLVQTVIRGRSSRELLVRTEEAFGTPVRIAVTASIADSAGNVIEPFERVVAPSELVRVADSDFDSFLPDSVRTRTLDGALVLWPDVLPGIQFSGPAFLDSPSEIQDRIAIADTSGEDLTFKLVSLDGVRFALDVEAEPEAPFHVDVTTPDSTYRETYVYAAEDRLGELTGQVVVADTLVGLFVDLFRLQAPAVRVATTPVDSSGTFRFTGLPGGSEYFVRAYSDLDGDQIWTAATLLPFAASEPIAWSPITGRVRARWETMMPDTLSIGMDDVIIESSRSADEQR